MIAQQISLKRTITRHNLSFLITVITIVCTLGDGVLVIQWCGARVSHHCDKDSISAPCSNLIKSHLGQT